MGFKIPLWRNLSKFAILPILDTFLHRYSIFHIIIVLLYFSLAAMEAARVDQTSAVDNITPKGSKIATHRLEKKYSYSNI